MPFKNVCLNSGIDPIVQILCIITIVIILGAIFSYRICIFWTSHLELTPKMFFFPTQSKLERGDNRSSHTLLIIESNTKKKKRKRKQLHSFNKRGKVDDGTEIKKRTAVWNC